MNILLIDDVRDFRAPRDEIIARTADEAIRILQAAPEQVWDEIWFDHDLGDVSPATTVVMDYMNERAFNGQPVLVNTIYVHTSNNVGGRTLMAGFQRYGYHAVRVQASDWLHQVG